jgi:hypothetical protein
VVISKDVIIDENSMLKSTQGEEKQMPESGSNDKLVV